MSPDQWDKVVGYVSKGMKAVIVIALGLLGLYFKVEYSGWVLLMGVLCL